jgi:riboflavin-specific deaminase-like protein
MPFPHVSEAATGDLKALQRLVFSALTGAAAWSRGAARPSAACGFGIDSAGRLAPLAPEARPWLVWHPNTWWTPGDGAPPQARAWLELYLPVCRPTTIAHLGQSLDGYIATGSGDSYYVTGADNVVHLHRLRALCDAVVVGAGTVARDDPRLTVRHVDAANPVRVILDPRRRLSAERRVFAAQDAPTLLVCAEEHALAGGERHGRAEVVAVPTEHGRLRLDVLLSRLRERGLRSVFVEGGGTTVSTFLEAGLLDRLHVAIAPLITGSGRPGLSLPARDKIVDCLRPMHRVYAMGGDVLFDCDLRAAAPARESVGERAATDTLARVL